MENNTKLDERLDKMMEKMFCFQCEQTLNAEMCSNSGVCGKTPEISALQDKLISRCVTLATMIRKKGVPATATHKKMLTDALFVTVTNVNFDKDSCQNWINAVDQFIENADVEICDGCANYDIQSVFHDEDEDVKSLKSLILFGLKGLAAYNYHANVLGYHNDEIDEFVIDALHAMKRKMEISELFDMVLETGRINFVATELLNNANVETYGAPEPTKVTTNVEPGPFIVVSGHDLHDLYLLLQQTEGKGVNVYTHGEMLPCHAYPKLKAFSHLKGNFGTAWQSQRQEFDNVPGVFLFTTNCIMPVKPSYKDNVFTLSVVRYPGTTHVTNTDFSAVIDRAIELGGYSVLHEMTGINGGNVLTTGFGKDAVLANAGTIVDAVKSGAISHFFLVGGCDGAHAGRNYYTDFVKQTPDTSVILTLACGKYRFNDLDLGEIGPFPRILDIGQCNDSYSAIKIAIALAEAFDCGINDLPLSFVLSWYEQKAVAVLLTLLYFGVQDIYLGPTLPAFVSPNVLNILVEKYNIRPISTPEADLAEILAK